MPLQGTCFAIQKGFCQTQIERWMLCPTCHVGDCKPYRETMPPRTLELLFETPYEGRCALKKDTINNFKKIISKTRRTVYSLEMRGPFHEHKPCPPPTHTSPTLPMSLLLCCHQEWHDTAGKETGSLWDLLLTLLQCNGPPSSRTSLWEAGPDGHQNHGPPRHSSGSGRAEGSGAQPAPSASLQTCPLCRVLQTI